MDAVFGAASEDAFSVELVVAVDEVYGCLLLLVYERHDGAFLCRADRMVLVAKL